MKTAVSKYLTTFIIGIVLVILVIALSDFSSAEDIHEKMRILSDGCTLAGVMIFLSGALVWISGQGVFYGIGYTMKHLFVSLVPGMGAMREERYYDYVTRRQENRKNGSFAHLLTVGGFFLAAAVVFTVLFYKL